VSHRKAVNAGLLDDLVWGELDRMRRCGRGFANAGDIHRRLSRRLKKAAKVQWWGKAGRKTWDVVAVLGSMLRYQEWSSKRGF
jgi:hypothetical protein